MTGSLKHRYEYDWGNEIYNLFITYEYATYHPADMNGPAEGGGCEEITFEVIGYQQYDEEGQMLIDWPVLTEERTKELTDKFYKILDEHQAIYEHFQEICDAEAEAAIQPDCEDYDEA